MRNREEKLYNGEGFIFFHKGLGPGFHHLSIRSNYKSIIRSMYLLCPNHHGQVNPENIFSDNCTVDKAIKIKIFWKNDIKFKSCIQCPTEEISFECLY